jgi:hypothetical protein
MSLTKQPDISVLSGGSGLRRNRSRIHISNSMEDNGSGFMITQTGMRSPGMSSAKVYSPAVNIIPDFIHYDDHSGNVNNVIPKMSCNVKENNLKGVKEMVLNSYKNMKYLN